MTNNSSLSGLASSTMTSLSSSWSLKSVPINKDIRCEFESEVFGGFVSIVDTQVAQNIEEVLIFAISSLYGVLECNNLVKILSLAKLRNFRIKTCDGGPPLTSDTPSRGIRFIIITDSLNALI
jgi:hypothetical protein